MVLNLRGPLLGQILPQGAAKDGIDDLNAAADAQHGHVFSHCQGNQDRLHLVSGCTELATKGRSLSAPLAVELWRDVLAAGHENAAAAGDEFRKHLGVIRQRKHDGHSTRLQDPLEVPRQHPIAVSALVNEGDDANEGRFLLCHGGSFRRWRPILAELVPKASLKSNKYSQEHSFSFVLDSFPRESGVSGTVAPNGTCARASRMTPEADGTGSSLRQTRCRLVFTISLATSKNRGHPCPLTQTRFSSSSRPSFPWSKAMAFRTSKRLRQERSNAAG